MSNLFQTRSRRLFWAATVLAIPSLTFAGMYVGQLFRSRDNLAEISRVFVERRRGIKRERKEKQKQQRLAQRQADREEADEQQRRKRDNWMREIQCATEAWYNARHRARATTAKGFKAAKVSDQVTAKDAQFWSFKRLAPPDPPAVDSPWVRNSIDRFVFATLDSKGIVPAEEADRRVLARRLWFNVTGLPPEMEQIEAFLKRDDPDAYDDLVNSLLDSPSFGERWGRVWLDIARYADSNGYEEDELRFNAYPYRDFVIWAMNHDLPFDDFIRWQIAGDELEPKNALAVAATGFWTAIPHNTFMPQERERWDELDDMVSSFGNTMLGVTVGCARCHDHPYDPIPSRDYYRLTAVVATTRRHQDYLTSDAGRRYLKWANPIIVRKQELRRIRFRSVKESNISKLEHFTEEEKDVIREPIDPKNPEQERLLSICERCLLITDEHLDDDVKPLPEDRQRHDQLVAEIDHLESMLPSTPPLGLTIQGSEVTSVPFLERGDYRHKGDLLAPGFLTVLTQGRPAWGESDWRQFSPSASSAAGPRAALAYWTTDVEHGAGALVARVIVNRLWQNHFGRGLVSTPNDFGSHGELPSHPELLEWLAAELVANDWQLKHIHRLILSSATYRQSCRASARTIEIDPENRVFSRFRRQHLTSEMVRDAMLAVSGDLNPVMYGPAIQPAVPKAAVFNTQEKKEDTWPSDYGGDRPSLWRRGIYVMLKRTSPVPMLRLFGAPDGSFSCAERKVTTVPTQALALWNSHFVAARSRRLGERILREVNFKEGDLTPAIRHLFLVVLSRPPTAEETAMAHRFATRSAEDGAPYPPEKTLADLGQVLMMSNEFFYLD